MTKLPTCPICQTEGITPFPFGGGVGIDCKRCTRYELTDEAQQDLHILDDSPAQKLRLSSWIYNQNQIGLIPRIDTNTLININDIRVPTLLEKKERYLEVACKKAPKYNDNFTYDDPEISAAIFAETLQDIQLILRVLKDEELVLSAGKGYFSVSPKGYFKNQEWGQKFIASKRGFVAMWFDKSTEEVWIKGLGKGILAAGYDPFRVDTKEHVNKICDEIIAGIKGSKFLVADFTGHRGGVYFEAGFAMGLGIPVIWTCRKDEIEKLHFDIRQYNFIDWENPKDLAKRIQHRIEAILGDGPLKLEKKTND